MPSFTVKLFCKLNGENKAVAPDWDTVHRMVAEYLHSEEFKSQTIAELEAHGMEFDYCVSIKKEKDHD